jgi:hypothetical protein
MPEHHYEFGVEMTCSGCSGAIERVLKKLDGMSFLPLPFMLLNPFRPYLSIGPPANIHLPHRREILQRLPRHTNGRYHNR